MKVVVYPHELAIGGAPINAIDLGWALSRRGHEVLVYGVPGPLVDRVERRGLRFIAARRLRYRPAPSRMAQLARLVRAERVDIVHAYEWPPCLDAYLGTHTLLGTPLACTVLSMTVSPLVPPSVPLLVGTEQIAAEARRVWGAPVGVLEPPVDVDEDRPGATDPARWRRDQGLGPDELVVGLVSRLACDLKLDALIDAVAAMEHLAPRFRVRLMVAGGGAAEAELHRRAAIVNARVGREVVRLLGSIQDPRPVYEAADVMLGMGSSALRAMAFGKPLVVQGERGFSQLLDAGSWPTFAWTGFFGVGSGANPVRLAAQIAALLESPAERRTLGDYGRQLVVERFALSPAAERAEAFLQQVVDGARRPWAGDVVRAATRAVENEFRQHMPRQRTRRLPAPEHDLPPTLGCAQPAHMAHRAGVVS